MFDDSAARRIDKMRRGGIRWKSINSQVKVGLMSSAVVVGLVSFQCLYELW